MNFQRLRYFVVVAEELNFSRAAERLRMAQPPLSYQIKRLEEELGVQLFHRTKRSVRLTDAGRLLLVEARGLLVHAEQTASVVHRVGQGEVGRLTVGFVPSAANRVLPPILRAFGERFPSVELLLREVDPDRLLRGLSDGRVDVGAPCVEHTTGVVESARQRTFRPHPEISGGGPARQDRRALPASRFRAQSGTGGVANANYSQPRRRRHRGDAGPRLLAEPSESRGRLQVC
jgi:DNA-binding transcriptional LysR family regulator